MAARDAEVCDEHGEVAHALGRRLQAAAGHREVERGEVMHFWCRVRSLG